MSFSNINTTLNYPNFIFAVIPWERYIKRLNQTVFLGQRLFY